HTEQTDEIPTRTARSRSPKSKTRAARTAGSSSLSRNRTAGLWPACGRDGRGPGIGEVVMPYARPEALVSTEWLAAHLSDPHIRVLDSSYKQPGITPTARADYDAGHIPGAAFFDIDDVAEPGTSL